MGFLDRFKKDRPMTEEELDQPSKVDGILYRDLQVVAMIQQNGSDLMAPRHVTFYLYFPSEQAADAAAGDLRSRGLEVRNDGPNPEYAAEHPDDPNPYPVVADSHGRALIPDLLRDTIAACKKVAADHGGEYDGWEAGPDEV